ncbi:AraC family transcriptional regulator [bacterium]|nr:AraC family transcriptional regulator [bacterium]MBU1919677.1 AraC family transcriptional regulator [bacterium]RQV98200.1 MAG: AraC family transcriptional regulator [bacterium]
MRDNTRDSYDERILRVQLFIQKHLYEKLTAEQLASEANFSPFHFQRIFSGMVGESLMEYIRRLRLDKAAFNLIYQEDSITQIAFDAGYDSHEAFTRAFRVQFGESPQQFRRDRSSFIAQRLLENSKHFNVTLAKPGGKQMEAKIEKMKPMKVAFVRHVGPYNQCEAAWGKLCGNPAVQKELGQNTAYIGICYDDPDITAAGKIRYDACATVSEQFEPVNGIETQVIEGGDYVVLIHHGSYDGLHDKYRWLYGEWLPGSGREAKSAPSLEIYDKHGDMSKPEELITRICVPLK